MSKNGISDGKKFYDCPKIENKEFIPNKMLPPTFDGYSGGFYGRIPHHPSTGKYVAYWERKLYLAIAYSLPLHLPENWERGFVLNQLTALGFLGVVEVSGMGVHATECSLNKHGIYHDNRNGMNKKYKIGKNCELLRLTPDYIGLNDIVRYHAELLSKATVTLAMNLVSSRFSYLIGAKNETGRKALERIIDSTYREEPFIIGDFALKDDGNPDFEPWHNLFGNVRNNWIGNEVQEVIEKQWLCALRDLGIPTPYEKAEHTIDSENTALSVASGTVIDVCIDCLEDSIKRIKKLFPYLDISVNRKEALYYAEPINSGNAENVPGSEAESEHPD